MQNLEMRRTRALRDLEAAKNRALAQADVEERRLQHHLQALAEYGSRARDLLEQADDRTFLQVPGFCRGGGHGGSAPVPCSPWLNLVFRDHSIWGLRSLSGRWASCSGTKSSRWAA